MATADDLPPVERAVPLACKADVFDVDVLDALSAIRDDTEEAQREQLRIAIGRDQSN